MKLHTLLWDWPPALHRHQHLDSQPRPFPIKAHREAPERQSCYPLLKLRRSESKRHTLYHWVLTICWKQKCRVRNPGLISTVGKESVGIHTRIFLLLGICLKQIKKTVLNHSWHQDESSFEIQALHQIMPFSKFLTTIVENSFFASNRINNVIHKYSRIFFLIQLEANSQHENFQLY